MGYKFEDHPAGQRGLTTVTIVATAAAAVVVLAAIGAFAVPRLLPKSPEQRYEDDRLKLQNAVLVYITGYSPRPVTLTDVSGPGRFADSKKDIYPTKARLMAGSTAALKEVDAGNEEITSLVEQSVPGGSKKQSGRPDWEDADGDSVRNPASEVLFYHKASPEPTVDHWNTETVTFEDTDHVVDSRYWFMEIDDLVERGFLEEVLESASPDNSVAGTGSYSWYIDENGKVQSMLYSYPRPQTKGFQGVYP